MNWKVISSEYVSTHPYFRARKDRCEMPDGKIVDPYYVVELPLSACALAITESGEALLVKQYRHPIGETILELPGGFIDAGEDPEKGMARELLEETGYEFPLINFAGRVSANPGLLSGYTYLYLARGGRQVASQKLDHNEEIEVLRLPVGRVREMLANNEIVQSLHVSCLLYAFKKLDELEAAGSDAS